MAFEDIATKYDDLALRVFVSVDVYDTDTGDTTTLYFSDAEILTDRVGGSGRYGTYHQWLGRIEGWSITKPNQALGASKYAYPSARLDLFVTDSSDEVLEYTLENWDWDGQDANVWLAAWSDGAFVGVRQQIKGTVRKGPETLETHSSFTLEVVGPFFDTRVPNPRFSMATEYGAGFIQPVVLSLSDTKLSQAVTDTDTTFHLPALPTDDVSIIGQVMLIHDSGELVYVTDADGGAQTIEVVRGYRGTSAQAHAVDDYLYMMTPGPNQVIANDDIDKMVLPFIYARGTANRGLVDVSSYVAGRDQRNYATGAYGSQSDIQIWLSAGKGAKNVQHWRRLEDVITNHAGPTTYNDYNFVAGTPLVAGTPITPLVVNYHMIPHPAPSGSYFQGMKIVGDGNEVGYSEQVNAVDYWVLAQGVTDNGISSGFSLRSPSDLIAHMITDEAALDLLLLDWVCEGRITGYNAGGWLDEYSGVDYFDRLYAIVPAFEAKESPQLMDVFQEAADLCNGDVWTREGKLYPQRRQIHAVEVTINPEDFAQDGRPRQDRGQEDVYCNEMVCNWAQDILSHPALADDHGPVAIAFEVALKDYNEQERKAAKSTTVTRQWCRLEMDSSWIQQETTGPQMRHMLTWRAAHLEQFQARSTSQVWVESPLPARFAWIEQGMTVQYDVSPVTSRRGQVRHIEISGGRDQEVVVTARSWHVPLTDLSR